MCTKAQSKPVRLLPSWVQHAVDTMDEQHERRIHRSVCCLFPKTSASIFLSDCKSSESSFRRSAPNTETFLYFASEEFRNTSTALHVASPTLNIGLAVTRFIVVLKALPQGIADSSEDIVSMCCGKKRPKKSLLILAAKTVFVIQSTYTKRFAKDRNDSPGWRRSTPVTREMVRQHNPHVPRTNNTV